MTEFKRLQELSGFTNESLALHFGVAERTITRWRSGKVEAKAHVINALKELIPTSKKSEAA